MGDALAIGAVRPAAAGAAPEVPWLLVLVGLSTSGKALHKFMTVQTRRGRPGLILLTLPCSLYSCRGDPLL